MANQIISIGIDQSYERTGISIFVDGNKKMIKSLTMPNESKSVKRNCLKDELVKVFEFCKSKPDAEVMVIIERIRLFSKGFVNINYIKSIGALNALIVDTAMQYNINVYSVDTRNWKSTVIGTSKPEQNEYGVPDEKWPTVKWCIDNGWEDDILIKVEGRKKVGTFIRNDDKYMYDNDAADSAAIAYFAFTSNKNKLEIEG